MRKVLTWQLRLLILCLSAEAQMGLPGGGETQAIALHPTNAQIIYVGAAKGLCKTTKGGKDNWPSMGLAHLSPRHIVLDPSNSDVIYTGTYEMGVYKSTDAAGSWQAVNAGIANGKIRGLAIDPTNGQTIYAGTDGGGVFKTTDGGASWREINHGLIDKTLRTLIIDPRAPDTLYAGTWHGVYKTTDGGENWKANRDGLYDIDVRALATDPTHSQILYAATDPGGVYRSTDGGWTWTLGAKPLIQHILTLAVDPHSPTHVYAGTTKGVFQSTDSAESFRTAGLQWSNRTWTLVFDDRTTPATLYYGGEGGVLKTQDGGKWWDVTGPQRN